MTARATPATHTHTDMNTVWIVDDDHSIRWVIEKALTREGIDHTSFTCTSEVLQALDHGAPPPQVLLSDIRMPGDSGLDLLRTVHQRHPQLAVIIMTAYSDLESAVCAFEGGAFEYLPKPFDISQALTLVRRALVHATHRPHETPHTLALAPEILGQAPAMQEVFRTIGRLSQSHATVLINGESGTGKELVARALHRHSPRRDAPFIALNTAAIPRDLLESELFGHERGAFTGASAQRRGRFEEAHGGTLFLDEIGDMPADMQTRLLRVLSDGHFYRVGGQRPLHVDVRIITATHQDLEERVRQGLFREDLFHRLNVIRLRLPSLRERRADIPLLAHHFLQHSAHQLHTARKRLTPAAVAHLQTLAFPGNVRQLENLCHWLTVMAPGAIIDIADLPPELRTPDAEAAAATPDCWETALGEEVDRRLAQHPGTAYASLTQAFERTLIERALVASGGRRIQAAALLGIGRNTLARKIQALDIAATPDEDTPSTLDD